MLYDITPPITKEIKVWPGDTPPSREVLLDIKAGASVTLSTLHATVHLGAHADGPNHYGADSPGIGERSLAHYLGPCQVVRAEVKRGKRVRVEDLQCDISSGLRSGISNLKSQISDVQSRISDVQSQISDFRSSIRAERVLIATGTFPDPTQFNEDFAALDPDLVDALHALGVRTVGIDTPSVDLFDSKDLPAHKRFLAHDMAILEGLILHDVPPGEYELIALPLKLMGFDASPVRAVLRPLER